MDGWMDGWMDGYIKRNAATKPNVATMSDGWTGGGVLCRGDRGGS